MVRVLVEEAINGSNILSDDRKLTATLENRGFQTEDTLDALSWVHHNHSDTECYDRGPTAEGRGHAVRVFHPEERLAFSPAAHGLLHKLYTAGAIDDLLREEIIQRCIDLASGEINLEKVQTIALFILLKERRDVLGRNILDILEAKNFRPHR